MSVFAKKALQTKHAYVAGLLLAAASVVSAQTAAPAPAPAPATAAAAKPAAPQHAAKSPSARRADWKKHMEQRKAMMQKRRAAHLAKFKAALKITPDQEGAWQAFTTAMAPQPRGTMEDRKARMEHMKQERAEFAKMTTPERIDAMHARMDKRRAEMTDRMAKREDAIKTFYAALNPEQQKIFDAHALQMAKHRWMHKHGRGGKGHEHGDWHGHGPAHGPAHG